MYFRGFDDYLTIGEALGVELIILNGSLEEFTFDGLRIIELEVEGIILDGSRTIETLVDGLPRRIEVWGY